MSNDQPARRPPAKSSGGGAPMGSAVSIAIAVIAVVVGFLILRNITSDGSKASENPSVTTGSTSPNSDESTTSVSTADTAPPTTAALVTTGATVVVANASGKGGAAGQFTQALSTVGFTMGTATNASGPDQRLTTSKVYYVTGAANLAVATSVAQVMGPGITTELMPTPVPVDGADLKGATVLVMLGTDLAGNPLNAIAPATTPTLPTAPVDVTTTVA